LPKEANGIWDILLPGDLEVLSLILGKGIRRHVELCYPLVVWAIVLTTISSLFVVIPAYLLKPFVDQGMTASAEVVSWKIPWIANEPGSLFSWRRTELVLLENISPNKLLIILTLIAFVSVIFKSITIYLAGLCSAAFSNRAVRELRVDLFRKFVSLPLSFHNRKRSGELIARATADLTVTQALVSNIVIGIIQYPLTILIFLTYLAFMNYRLTLLVFVVVPLIVGLVRLFGRKVKKHATRMQDAIAQVTSAYQEALLCLKVVQGFFTAERESRIFGALAHGLYKRVMHWSRWYLGLGPMMDVSAFMMLPAVLIVGKVFFHHTLGELMSMVYAFSRVYSPVKRLAGVHAELRTLQGATRRVFEIMETEEEFRVQPDSPPLGRFKKSLRFDRVSFGYSPSRLILKDVSFSISAGEMVAIVGESGAGKSTLLDLILRFYDVTSGSITIDGSDIRKVRLDSLRKQIGVVNQEILLFHNTVANNISYGFSGAGMAEIVTAAKAARAHDFIKALPSGYQTIVGDRGSLLSGGERQRLAIARALLIKPSILIMDEAASALDAQSEMLVQETIEKLRGRLTILVVAHRLSTIMNADQVYVLEAGRIVESGTRDQLLALGGRFRSFYDIQYK
jgi:subfamily B ATP-binding cassette protein MsbA